MIVEYAQEYYHEVIDEIVPMLSVHGDEVEDYTVVPVLEVYEAGDSKDIFAIYTMRHEGKLVGYAGFWKLDNPHRAGSVTASNDLIYVHPDYRGALALKFFEWIEQNILTDVIIYTFKTMHDHPELMEHLEMKFTEKVYKKVLV